MPARLPLFHVDAFTERLFSGNPAAVCILDADREEAWFQAVAAEMNLSETAFLRRDGKGWRLRWFTPTVEMDLCGHATLASAHVLWEEGHAAPGDVLSFDTRSGELKAVKRGEDIELDFPAEPAWPVDPPVGLLEALGVAAPRAVAANRMDYLVALDTEGLVRAVRPAFGPLAAACGGKRGVIVTAPSDAARFDFVSRFSAPAAGIDEDPVTGSAHCCLAPYWAGRLGKPGLVGYQASRRGGVVSVRVEGRRVALGGKAVTVFAGELAGV
jgi:predicted PhzF superfamily epimerase YddE/YHI9